MSKIDDCLYDSDEFIKELEFQDVYITPRSNRRSRIYLYEGSTIIEFTKLEGNKFKLTMIC